MTEAEFRAFLDDISACFTRFDFALWRSRILLPFSLVTRDGPVLLPDEAALARNFELYLESERILCVDEVYRRPISLEDCRDGTWIGTYETELLCRGQRVTPPYISSALIHATPEGWRMSSILNALGHHSWTGTHPTREGKT
ncbi:MAG TPA: hypothetical protein DD444_02055 [Citreicella sp.]|jgi:hypothetical protein|nr:hypothetical protein [Citreicella sp.]|tara:strand:- start:145 stop:570 length:426 start_codon:yes stop_codon:yes gene_type:complete